MLGQIESVRIFLSALFKLNVCPVEAISAATGNCRSQSVYIGYYRAKIVYASGVSRRNR